MKTLGEALPGEMARVRDLVMPAYIELGAAGHFALSLMRAALDRAAHAMIAGDLPAMLAAHEELKGFHV